MKKVAKKVAKKVVEKQVKKQAVKSEGKKKNPEAKMSMEREKEDNTPLDDEALGLLLDKLTKRQGFDRVLAVFLNSENDVSIYARGINNTSFSHVTAVVNAALMKKMFESLKGERRF